MATTADFRNGMIISLGGELYTVVEFLHVKPGKGGAFVRTKLKRISDGSVLERTFRAGERVEEVRVEKRQMQYLYQGEGFYYFMDSTTYDQIPISDAVLGAERSFLKEGSEVTVLTCDGKTIGVELPIFVELEVVETEPGLKGDTVSGGSKPARLETGAMIQVPLFVQRGDKVKVDTRVGNYIERV